MLGVWLMLATFGAVGCASATHDSDPRSAASRPAAVPRALASPDIGFSGAGRLAWASDADLARYIDLLAGAGVRKVRLDVSWPLVEPGAGQFNWAPLDRVVTAMRARGIDILGIIDYTPPWASGHSETVTYKPESADAYGDFAGTVAARYRGRIAAYEIWNEPNGKPYFLPGPDPEFYTAMLTSAYTAIKRHDPGATVVGGAVGLAGDTPITMNAATFVDRMYRAGAHGFFDALSVHAYTYPHGLTVGADQKVSVVSMIADIRATMVGHGDSDRKIWATEVGFPSAGPGNSVGRQAESLTALIDNWAQLPFGGPIYIHELVDRKESDVDHGSTTESGYTTLAAETSFGVVRSDFTPKPGYATLHKLVAAKEISNPAVTRLATAALASPFPLGEVRTPVYEVVSRAGIQQTIQRYASGQVICGRSDCHAVPAPLVDYFTRVGYLPSTDFTGTHQDVAAPVRTRVFYSPSTGVHSLTGDMLKVWDERLGLPISDEQVSGENTVVRFEHGSIRYSPSTGAVVAYS